MRIVETYRWEVIVGRRCFHVSAASRSEAFDKAEEKGYTRQEITSLRNCGKHVAAVRLAA